MFKITRKRLANMSSALTILLSMVLATQALAKGPVAQHVSVGGPDVCVSFFGVHPGCDGNFSLTANISADGSMSGEYTDRFSKGFGFHAVIDCVSIVGNEAWVSGWIVQGIVPDLVTGEPVDVVGWPVAARVRDNGTSANAPADQISWSQIGDPTSCTEHIDYPAYDVPQGQVVIN
ncbi:MAG: hypothetical protein A2W35_05050 [Chloroflexi bacterium RBG_16_57_11]|nr:MAG: hypothetical protein A2W35_05050 [Chloroflexi bacterium RBG_16_57_11]